MEQHLNLIKTDYKEVEKRVFPRFPYNFLTFKDNASESEHVYEVRDISYTGMQLSLKDGGHNYRVGSKIGGEIHWRKAKLETFGIIKWVKDQRVGVAFEEKNENFSQEIQNFLGIDNILAGMRPVHLSPLTLELPANLKYWLRADGPFELFIWRHKDGEISRFQVIIMENFVEWEDCRGVKTGRVLKKRDLDTPLICEDECLFQMDDWTCQDKLGFASKIVGNIPSHFIPVDAIDFLKLKLGN